MIRPFPGGSGKHGTETGEAPPGTESLGLALFLVSLGALFVGSLVAYAVVRARAEVWPPPDLPPLPGLLWLSTALLAAVSLALEIAARSRRPFRPDRLRASLATSLALALGFLGSQIVVWILFVRATPGVSLYGWLLLFLTVLHAAHVLGGLVPLVILTVRASHGLVGPGGHDVRSCATYWHFLGAVWIVLYGMLILSA